MTQPEGRPDGPATARPAAHHIVEALLANGVERAFCVPGESYLPLLDALAAVEDRLQLVTCRHEAAAANMAAAHGRLTGRPGICLVTRGPGATHASIGLHTAMQDSLPLILFVGHVPTGDFGREAFQEVDFAAFFGPLVKWAAVVPRAERLPEFVQRAFAVATSGRPGPVVLALPEDVLEGQYASPPARPAHASHGAPDAGAIADVAARLRAARRPLLWVGGSTWTAAGWDALQRFATARALPVATSFRRKDAFDNAHPCYAGDLGFGMNPKLAARVRECDLIVALGTRLGEVTTAEYSLLAPPFPSQVLVHVHPDPDELGHVYRPDVAIAARPEAVIAALETALPAAPLAADWTRAARTDYEAFVVPPPDDHPLSLATFFRELGRRAPPDAIYTNGAGNYALYLHRFVEHRRLGTQVAPTSGAMGYGVPAAIAAKLLHPSRTVIGVAGDGCFLMAAQELATARQYDVGVKFLVVDNGTYGTIRMHQERRFPGRPYATALRSPDFVAFARSFGIDAWRADTTADALAAADRWLAHEGPALLHLVVSPEQIAPGRLLSTLAPGRAS
jgi:acetolactate synthase-1/2/3 large subunit